MWHPVKMGFSLLSMMLSLVPLLLYLMMTNTMILLTWDIMFTPSSPISLTFMFDTNGILLMVTVLFIASNVLFFTSTYMSGDKFMSRFVGMVVSFVAAMCMLVILPNIITLLLGWDGLGLTSYLLVLYYQTPKSQGAAMITAMTNRLGDIFILFTIAWSLNTNWLPLSPWTCPTHTLTGIMLIIAATTKSAQYPFISWLPAAMAAPTPVSALVHSSTLVTAGVFILVRFFNFLITIPAVETYLLFVACLTAFIAGLSALAECDMKKIIALSTLSQLGTMMFSLGMSMPYMTFFHLITHALFKALLFMAAGILIHMHNHTQDLRSFGLLTKSMPLISSMMVVANFALMGMPFTAGFYSKDLIIESLVINPHSYMMVLLFLCATSLTSAYTIRFLTNVMWAPRHSTPAGLFQPLFNLLTMGPMMALSQATIVIGPTLFWLMILPESESTLPLILKLQALLMALTGTLLGCLIVNPKTKSSLLINFKKFNFFMTSMAFATPINSQTTARTPLYMGHKMHKNLDGGWVEILGGQGTMQTLSPLSSLIMKMSNKSLSMNVFMMMLTGILLILLTMY